MPARMLSKVRVLVAIFRAGVCLGCATEPSGPPPALGCPTPIQVVSPDNNPVPVTYQAPVASVPNPFRRPVRRQRIALRRRHDRRRLFSNRFRRPRVSCNFNVTVAPPPHLEKDRTLAFGDSITFGSSAICPGGSPTSARWTPAALLTPWADGLVPPATSYPSVLQASLRARYTAQSPVVVNAGLPGESANDSDTRRRFTRALAETPPRFCSCRKGLTTCTASTSTAFPTTRASRTSSPRCGR